MSNQESNRDVDIDLARLAVGVWERKGKIALITLLSGAAAFFISNTIPPLYKSEARLLIESQAAPLSNNQQSRGGEDPLLDALNIVSQTQILQSVDLIKRVADEHKLYELPEFDEDAKPTIISHLLISLGLKQDPHVVPPTERVLEAFRERLMVYQIANSRVIAVEFSSEDQKLAAEIPNTILKTYLAMQSGAKLGTTEETVKWLEPEIGALRARVLEADRKVAEFRNSADLLSVGQGSTFASRQLSDISTELARLRSEKATADARAENIRQAIADGRPIDNFSDVVGSAMIQRLKESESQIQGQISDLSTSLLEAHPRLRGLRAQLTGIRSQIEQETRKIVSTLANESRVANIRERELSLQLDELKANSARAGEQEVRLNELEREASAQRQLLENYLARYREATSRAGSQDSTPADARIISTAVEAREAYFPKTGAYVIVAALAAMIFSAIVVMLMELFSGRALRPVGGSLQASNKNRSQDVESDAALSSVSATPAIQTTPVVTIRQAEQIEEPFVDHRADLRDPDIDAEPAHSSVKAKVDEFPEYVVATDNIETVDAHHDVVEDTGASYEDFTLSAVAEFLSMRGAKPVVVVVSPSGVSGSALSVKLARRLAVSGRPTVMIDMTVNGEPSRLMAKQQGLPGIMDLLIGNAAFGDAIHNDQSSPAHIVPRGITTPSGPVKVYDRLSMVVGALSDAYETVLIECGAAQIDSVNRILNHLSAEVVLSVPNGDPEVIDSLIDALKAAGHSDIMPMTAFGDQRDRASA